MALENVTVDYTTNGLKHKLTIDCGSDPINVSLFWKKATDTAFIPIETLNNQTGIINVDHNIANVNDITPPQPPNVTMESVVYNNETESLSFIITMPETDTGTLIYYKVVDLTNETQIDEIPAYVISGLDRIALDINESSTTILNSQQATLLLDKYEFKISNPDRMKYIHLASIDNSGNISTTSHQEIDLAPPTKDNIFYLNEIRVAVPNQLLRFSVNRMTASISGGSHPRGVVVTRDVKLVDADTNEVFSSFENLTTVTNFNLNVIPFNNPRIKNDTRLQLVSTTYTGYGSTAGESRSQAFRIDLDTPVVKIDFQENLPLLIEKNTFSPLNLKWTASGEIANDIIKYKIQGRSKLNSDLNWSLWQDLGETYNTDFSITKDKLVINGFNVHEFRVCGVTDNGDTRFFNYPEFVSDILPIISGDGTSLIYFIRIPVGIYKLTDKRLVFSNTINGVSKNSYIEMDFNELTSTIGKQDIGFITRAIDPINHITSSNEPNYDSIIVSLREGLIDLNSNEEFNSATSKGYNTFIETTNTDVYMVGYIFNNAEDIPQNYNIEYVEDPNNPFRHTANLNIDSFLAIEKQSDNTLSNTIDLNVNNYQLNKYGSLYPPILEFDGVYENVSEIEGVIQYDPPVRVKSVLNPENISLNPDHVTISTSYIRSNGLDYHVDNDFDISNSLNIPGNYTVFSQVIYDDGVTEMTSSESILSFNITDDGLVYLLPSTDVDNSKNDGTANSYIVFNLNTNVSAEYIDGSVYKYTLNNTTNSKSISINDSTATRGTDSDGYITYIINLNNDFLSYGTNNIVLSVTFEGNQYTYSQTLDLIKPITDPSTTTNIFGPVNYHDSEVFDTSSKYNDAWVRIPSNKINIKNEVVIASYGNKHRALMPNYTIPFFQSHESIVGKRYSTPNSLRRSILDTSASFSGSVSEQQSFNTTLQDDKNPPNTPEIEVISDRPLNPFSSTGDTECVVMNDIKFRTINKSTEYTIRMFIDGKPYTENTVYDRTGKHSLTVIFSSTFNYKISYKVINFEIVKSYIFLPPLITSDPESMWEKKYNINIDWYMNDQDVQMGDQIRKEYRTSENSVWKLEENLTNGKSRFPIDTTKVTGDSYIVTARKTYSNGVQVEENFTLDMDYAIRNTPVPNPELEFDVNVNRKNGSVYVPSIRKSPEWTYSWTLNGIPYTEGTPITNFEHNKRDFTLILTMNDRYSDRSKTFTYSFEIDTEPPLKPLLNNFQNKIIYEIDDFKSITISNKQPGVKYTILLNGGIIPEGKDMATLPYEKLNGIHNIIIYGKKESNRMVNFSQYIFFINNNVFTTPNFHKKEVSSINNSENSDKETRIAIVPLSRQINAFDTPGELVVDKKSGDMSLVSNVLKDDGGGYVIEDITKDLKFKLKGVSNTVDQIRKSLNIYEEKIRSLEYPLPHLKLINTQLITAGNNFKTLLDGIENDLIKISNDNLSMKNEIIAIRAQFDSDASLVSGVNYTSVKNAINQYPSKKLNILNDHEKHLDMMSLIAKIMFNLRSVELVAIPKVTKTAFAAFKAKYEDVYNRARRQL